MKVVLTTIPGIEDVVKEEVEEKIKGARVLSEKFGFKGRILVKLPKKRFKELFSLKSIHHVIELVGSFEIRKSKEGLSDIRDFIGLTDFSKWVKSAKTFRISSQRHGEHEFTSIDVQKVAGEAFLEKYPNLKVDLENFDLNIKIDVNEENCYVGILHTKHSLHFRDWLVYRHPAAIKPTLAYALFKLASVEKRSTVVDPMCGGGTILIEAALEQKASYYGLDISKKFLEGAMKNAKKAGVDSLIKFMRGDCRRLEKFFEERSVDRIITNPPYGVRIGKTRGVLLLYKDFLKSAYKVLKDNGKIVIITLRAKKFKKLVKEQKFCIVHEREVLHGNLLPHVFLLEKL